MAAVAEAHDIGPAQKALTIGIGVAAASPVILLPIVVGAMIDSLGISAREAGFVAAAEMLGAGTATLALSLRVHSWNRRTIVFCSLSVFILANLAAILVDSWAALAAVRFVAGIGGATAAATVNAALASTRNPDRSFGLFITGALTLAVAGLPGLSLVTAAWGLTGAYTVFAILGIVALLAAPRFPLFNGDRVDIGRKGGRVARGRAVVALLAILIYFIGQGAVWTYLERIGVAAGIDAARVGGALGIAHVAGILGATLAAWLGHRLGRSRPMIAGFLVSFGSVYLLGGSASYAAYLAAAGFFAFAWYFTLSYFFGLKSALDPAGRVIVLAVTMQAAGLAIGPALAGVLVTGSDFARVAILGMLSYGASLALITPVAVVLDREARTPAAPAVL